MWRRVSGSRSSRLRSLHETPRVKAENMDVPKMLGRDDARRERLEQVRLPHVAPLNDFVDRLRLSIGPDACIPYFDPWDGGTDAEVLFLLEAPGPRACASGFVSRNNADETAKNFFELNREAGIPRGRSVVWNVVPWYIGSGTRIRPATQADVDAGSQSLAKLLQLLPRVRAVVLLGKKAQRVRSPINAIAPQTKCFSTPHPSAFFVNRSPGNREVLLGDLWKVKAFLSGQ